MFQYLLCVFFFLLILSYKAWGHGQGALVFQGFRVRLWSCSICELEGNSKHGLKVHMARKHTLHLDNKSRKCELCEKKFENEKEMKRHLKTHSYKKVDVKCVDCDSVGASEETMEVYTMERNTPGLGMADLLKTIKYQYQFLSFLFWQ
jgi:hypothetical protein